MFLCHKFQVSDVAIHGILPGRSCCIPLVKRQPGGMSWIHFVRVRYNPKTTGTTFISILGLIYSLVKQHNYGKHDYFKRYINFFNVQYSIAVLVYQDGNHILFFLAACCNLFVHEFTRQFKASDMVDANDFDTFLDELVHEDIVVEQPFELDTCFPFSAKYDDMFFKTIAFVSKPLPTMISREFHTSFHIYM